MSSQAVPYRPISSACRDDLDIVKHHIRGQLCFVIGDPLAMEYHRLNEQEFALLNWLDGRRSANDIQRLFEQTFSPHQISLQEIEHYLVQFSQKGLLQSLNSDIGGHLERRSQKKRVQKKIAGVKSVLSIRLRGINPERILDFLTPRMGWFFSSGMVGINVLLMIAALLLLGLNFDQFHARLPQQFEYFSPRNWIGIALVVMVTKLLHELGHGIVATKFGCRCHDLGVMLMVFVPTLYVNASGSWKLADKWKRAAVGAAGVYVELSLAAVATFVWWYSQPGVVQYTALNVMATCSVSALLLNANPLMKFDGYYVLSDLWELPNLQQRSGQYLRERLMRLITATGDAESADAHATPRTKRLLLGYAVASYLFRFLIVFGIAFVLVAAFRSVGLELVGKMLACFLLAMLVLKPFISAFQYLRAPGRWFRVENRRVTAVGLGLITVSIAFFTVPLPRTVLCDGYLEPAGLTTVYAERSGTIEATYVEPGQWVDRGEPILRLQDLDLALEIARTSGEIAELEQQVQVIQQFARFDAGETRSRLEMRSRIQKLNTVLNELKQSQDTLTIRAPRSGHIIADWIDAANSGDIQTLGGRRGWSLGGASPGLEIRTVGASSRAAVFLKRGDLVCRVGNKDKLQAKLMINQHEVGTIQPGQKVEFLLASHGQCSLRGHVETVSQSNVDQVAKSMTLRHGGSIESTAATPGHGQFTPLGDGMSNSPTEKTYQATVVFNGSLPMISGYRGSGKVRQPSSPAFSQLTSLVTTILRFN